MTIWYPQIPIGRLRVMAGITGGACLLAGLYGALHDQVSYTISPEYFEKMKFHQFRFADFSWPSRAFAAEVGFLATWWVGLIGGWILARFGLAELWIASRRKQVVLAFALMVGVAACTGFAAALLGANVASGDLREWEEWREGLGLYDLRSFVIVAYLHAGSYLGGLLGLVCAGLYVRRALARATLKLDNRRPSNG
jgi:hypothetical protein